MTISVSPRAKEVTVELLAVAADYATGEWIDCRGHHYKTVQVVVAGAANVDVEISNDLATASVPTVAGATGITASKFLEVDDACVAVRARVNVVASKAITGISKHNPAVVTSALHGLSNGDRVRISGVVGMVEVNGNVYTVANVAANTFELSGINSVGFTTYVSDGIWEKLPTGSASVILHGILES